MTWDTIQQVVRILMYHAAAYFFGTAIADGNLFQAALSGMMSVGAFIWWMIVEKNKPAVK